MNSLPKSQIKDLQVSLVGENNAMVLLPQTGIKNGLKFPVQNCTADQREKYTHVHREEIYMFWRKFISSKGNY